MASVNTIRHLLPQHAATLLATTRLELAPATVYVPEVTGRAFRSVVVRVYARDGQQTAVNMTANTIGVKLGNGVWNDAIVTDTIGHSTDHQSWLFSRDVTAEFAANFGTGVSQLVQVAVQFDGIATQNISVALEITYEYDESAAPTRIKTVHIPLESLSGTVGQTLTAVGSFPALNTFLPEAGKVLRQVALEVTCRTGASSNVEAQLALAFDAEAEVLDDLHVSDLTTSVIYVRNWVRDDLDSAVAHTLSARSTASSHPFSCFAAVLVVTYEYDEATTTTVLNSLRLPAIEEPGFIGRSAAPSRAKVEVFIHEPGPITLQRSALAFLWNANGQCTLAVQAGAQASARSYFHAQGNADCMFTALHGLDADSAAGAAWTLARGRNVLDVVFWGTNSSFPWITNCTALFYLNYTSAKAAAGTHAHAHTTAHLLAATGGDATQQDVPAVAPTLPTGDHFVVSAGIMLDLCAGGAASGLGLSITAQVLANEGDGGGWTQAYAGHATQDNEVYTVRSYARCRTLFRRYLQDPDPARLALGAAREYRRVAVDTPSRAALLLLLTLHQHKYTVSGNVEGYTGDGSGITVDLHRAASDEHIGRTTTAVGGSFSLPWYDDTEDVYVQADVPGVGAGRSAVGRAS